MDNIVISVNLNAQVFVMSVSLEFVKYVNKIIIYKIINVLNKRQ